MKEKLERMKAKDIILEMSERLDAELSFFFAEMSSNLIYSPVS